MCVPTSDAHGCSMNELIAIPDPIVALMVTEIQADRTGRLHHRAHATQGVRRRRRRFEQAARLRRLLA